jgi:hypothetical protein
VQLLSDVRAHDADGPSARAGITQMLL